MNELVVGARSQQPPFVQHSWLAMWCWHLGMPEAPTGPAATKGRWHAVLVAGVTNHLPNIHPQHRSIELGVPCERARGTSDTMNNNESKYRTEILKVCIKVQHSILC